MQQLLGLPSLFTLGPHPFFFSCIWGSPMHNAGGGVGVHATVRAGEHTCRWGFGGLNTHCQQKTANGGEKLPMGEIGAFGGPHRALIGPL